MSAQKPPLDPETLRHVNRLLEVALALPVEARAAWLKNLPPEDAALTPLLGALLERAAIDTDTFMQRPLGVTFEDLGALGIPTDQPGDLVGPYRLVRPLGEGGMGTVWLAERADSSLQRRVALKLPRSGWALGLVQRMARERDILAGLEHPHIARLYDAGSTDQGRPYLAMEYVDGEPIDVYARAKALSIPARLRLILQVADAVAHAHARLVVHRDLKPSNILVTAEGSVRLLDFGVAKLLEGDATGDSHLTRITGPALTPTYASPEQIRGEPLTVGSDVYSLAVVLYELLAGEPPYQLRRTSAAALEEAILEVEVAPPSQRALDRTTARALRGDLDNILAKALKKEPAQRYASVAAFADDLTRHLEQQPVSAHRDSFAYRSRRFVQRNALAVSAGTALAVAVLAGSGVALWQAAEASLQRDRALQRLARNEAVSDFLEVMFTQGVPDGGGDVVREMLRRSETFASRPRNSEPEHQAAILLMLASQHAFMAEPARAEPLLEKARTLLRRSPDRDLKAQVDCTQALVVAFLGRSDAAIALLEPWLTATDIDHNIAAACLQRRAERARDSFDAANALHYARLALDRLGRAKQPSASLEATLQGEYANALQVNGRALDADQAFERSLAAFSALGRDDAADAVIARANWAASKLSSGDIRRGLALCEEAMRAQAQQGGTAGTALKGNCAYALELLGRDDAALSLYADVLAAATDGNVMSRVYALSGQANVRLQQGDSASARDALELARTAMKAADFPAGHAIRLRYVQSQARYDLATGEPQRARDALDGVIRILLDRGTRNSALAAAYRLRAAANAALNAPADALADATAAHAVAQSLQGGRPHSFHTGLGLLTLAQIHRQQGNAALAVDSARSALDHLRETAGADHPEAVKAERLLRAG